MNVGAESVWGRGDDRAGLDQFPIGVLLMREGAARVRDEGMA
jgi:hypothetical protein